MRTYYGAVLSWKTPIRKGNFFFSASKVMATLVGFYEYSIVCLWGGAGSAQLNLFVSKSRLIQMGRLQSRGQVGIYEVLEAAAASWQIKINKSPPICCANCWKCLCPLWCRCQNTDLSVPMVTPETNYSGHWKVAWSEKSCVRLGVYCMCQKQREETAPGCIMGTVIICTMFMESLQSVINCMLFWHLPHM